MSGCGSAEYLLKGSMTLRLVFEWYGDKFLRPKLENRHQGKGVVNVKLRATRKVECSDEYIEQLMSGKSTA